MKILWKDSVYVLTVNGVNYQFVTDKKYTIDDPDVIHWMSDKKFVNVESEEIEQGELPVVVEPPNKETVDPATLETSEDTIIEDK